MTRLATKSDFAWLEEAIKDAKGWRGAEMPESYPAFDARILRMRAALEACRATRKALHKLKKDK